MTSSEPFPVVTRQAARNVAGFPTEVLMQIFDDRTLVYINQGKIGRMLQVLPPTTTRRRALAHGREEDNDEQGRSNGSNMHPSLESTFLPPPDPSSSVSSIFGTPKSEELGNLEHLYASQVAAILFAKARLAKEAASGVGTTGEDGSDGDAAAYLLTADKPVVVALGLTPAFLEAKTAGAAQGHSMEDQRRRFKDVMGLVASLQ